MAKYAHPDVLDNGPNYIKANCNKMAVVSAYTPGDSYATVAAAIIAEAAMTSGDFTNGSSGSNRTLTTALGKADAAANGTANCSHIVFLDTVNEKVLWVTEETSLQEIHVGNPVSFPQLTYTAKQPV